MTDKYIIRTSDRKTFKECRELWNFNSKIRLNYEPAIEPQYFKFGTAIHGALEVYYNPETWHMLSNPTAAPAIKALATARFNELYPKPVTYNDDQGLEEWHAELDLGQEMLAYYYSEAPKLDQFKPVHTELEFEVPIIVPQADYDKLRRPFTCDSRTGALLRADEDSPSNFVPVVYQGRIDLIVEDYYGKLWLWDHKTAGKFDNITWLDLDEQVISYAWAVQHMLGIEVAGVIYSQLRKSVPKAPKVLKSGKLSVDKQQETTYSIYKKSLDNLGLPVAEYADHLEWLRQNEKQYIRRIQIQHTQAEYEVLGRRIALEAMDMLGDPSIYPNPGPMHCNRCTFFTPCLEKQANGDWEWLLDDLYVNRASKSA